MGDKYGYATRGRINRMCKYFRNRPVVMRYEYNDSLGGHQVREGEVKYDDFDIRGDTYLYIVFTREGGVVWEQELGVDWEFTGLGELKMCNSGPYCYFTIKYRQRNLFERLTQTRFRHQTT